MLLNTLDTYLSLITYLQSNGLSLPEQDLGITEDCLRHGVTHEHILLTRLDVLAQHFPEYVAVFTALHAGDCSSATRPVMEHMQERAFVETATHLVFERLESLFWSQEHIIGTRQNHASI